MSEFPHSADSKRQLRAHLLARRRELDTGALDARLLAALPALLTGRRVVAGYAPLAREPGGPQLPERVAALVDRLLLPVLRADDDLDWAASYNPPITAVAQDTSHLGGLAGELLLHRINGGETPPQERHLPTRLVIRASSGPPAASN